MSVKVLTHVFQHSEASGNDRVVLLVLADHAHDDGTGAYPAQAMIAHKARITDRTVRDCLRRLEDAGEIERTGTRPRGVVEYRVILTPEDSSGRKPDVATPEDSRKRPRKPSSDKPLVSSVSGDPPTSTREEPSEPSEAALRLCRWLEQIADVEPRKRFTPTQLSAADWLLAHVDHAELKGAVEWAHERTFWASKVLTAGELKRWWSKLRAEYRAGRNGSGRRSVGPSSHALRAEAAKRRAEGR